MPSHTTPPPLAILCFTALSLLLLPLAGCGQAGSATTDGRYTVTATTGMIGDAARAVAGEHANVQDLMGSGIDPHVYTPRRSDVAKLNNSDIVLYNGLHLEGRMADLLGRLSARVPTHPVAEIVWQEHLSEADRAEMGEDPHLWMDPMLWAEVGTVIAGILSEFDPDNAEDYQANARTWRTELEELDAYARQVLDTIPEDRRHLITAHDAFGYMSRSYGIDVHGIQGISSSSEAGLQDLNRLVDFIVEREIPAVFIESTIPDRNVRALIEGARSRGHEVVIGGELYSDAMGPSGTYEGTYIGMIDHNVSTIAAALGGSPPSGGMQAAAANHGN